MRFQIPIIVAGLAALTTSVVGDQLITVEGCDVDLFRVCGLYYSTFVTDFGRYNVDAHNGCRGTSVPGMTEFCVDWPRSRGHFKFSHQSFKRCLVRESTVRFTGDGYWGIECWRATWNERPCTWREIPSNGTTPTNGTVWEEGVNYSTAGAQAPDETKAAEVA